MRTFKIGTGEDRKFVILELQGARLRVTKGNADGSTRKSEKELPSEAAARSACEQMVRELIARGYVERNSEPSAAKARRERPVAAASKKMSPPAGSGGLAGLLEEAGEGDAEP